MFGVKLNKYRQMEIQLIGQKIVVNFQVKSQVMKFDCNSLTFV